MEELEALLREGGWKQAKGIWSGDHRRFSIHVEEVTGKWDRALAPFLAKAILESRARRKEGTEPIAVLKVARASALSDERLAHFVSEVAPNESWILLDRQGQFFPHVVGATSLRPHVGGQSARATPIGRKSRPLFTDLNQWLLKVLLAPLVEERLLTAPRRTVRNASTLAEAAQVSVPVAHRFLKTLEEEGQLDRRFGDLRVARPLELLQKWRDQIGHPARREVGVVTARGFDPTSLSMMVAYANVGESRRPPFVLGLHAACEELGLGHVKGALPVLWANSLDDGVLRDHGFVPATSRIDLVLRTPRYPESLFRGMVISHSKPTTDIIQCWLDVSHYRVRGAEQADFIWRRVILKAFGE